MTTVIMPLVLPDSAWQSPDVRRALRARDIGTLFRFIQHHSGASQARIGTATGMNQGRVNEVLNGRRQVSRLDVFERIADGLSMPDDARRVLGLAPQRETRAGGQAFDLAAFPEIVRVYSQQASAAAEIQRQAGTALEVDILAVRGLGLLGLRDSLLRPAVTRDDTAPQVRVLLLHPDSAAAAQRASEIGESPESLASGIRLAEVRLRELATIGDVQVYQYRTLPTWRIIRLDGTLFVSSFDTEWEGHESATYKILSTPHGPLYRGLRRIFDAMVDESERVI
ncbi:transcriptional regulator with XRE-family HTH domain [Kitasatospora sp. MAP12-15]|uniref:helix-turn-helix domain-containing protein n=1 Tax=unclassified Kitasatospora TaxID=2633591 RepID=UPI002476AB49|nr:helix-turn-helix domain-containing protein [Kitasatospora sp. MAP12-44]MDH6110366.1 transcriptional regulator with XRE-family HTH domain [Kitasatospora sp. MAP12-44]